MDLPTALVARAVADPAVSALAGDRVAMAFRAPGDGLPALVMAQVSEEREQHLDGETAMRSARVQLAALSGDYLEARALLEAAIAALIPPAEVAAGPGDSGTALFWQGELAGLRDTFEDVEGVGPVHRPIADLIVRFCIEP